jgi:hypothetical protein
MSLLLHLVGGREIRLNVDPDEWVTAFENALGNDKAVTVEDPTDGGILAVNPHQVLYWKVEPPSQKVDPAQ